MLSGALNANIADIGFLAYDEERSREVDFGPAFVVMANSYLLKGTSPIKASADVNREGVTVAAVKGQTQEHFVSAAMKRARVRVLDVMPPQARGRHAPDQWRCARVRHQSSASTRSRVGRCRQTSDASRQFSSTSISASWSPKATANRLAVIEQFVGEMRTSGFIKQSIDRAKLVGVSVAPVRKR